MCYVNQVPYGRPLQVGRSRAASVNVPSPHAPPKKRSRQNDQTFRLLPLHGPNRPVWDAKFNIPSASQALPSTSMREVAEKADKIHRAALTTMATDEELQRLPEGPPAFQDADGIELSENGRVALHNFFRPTRQSIVSTDWVHCMHEHKTRSWTVRMREAQFDYGDVFFGLTEASGFHHKGRSVTFDVAGNFWIGWSPQDLCHKNRKSNLYNVTGAIETGTFKGNKEAILKVTADMKRNVMSIKMFEPNSSQLETPLGSIEYPIPEWRSARLLVSLRSMCDTVKMSD